MNSPGNVIEQIEQALSTQANTQLFICHSNLHALQALSLQKGDDNICLYNEAVSIAFLKKHFNGKLIAIENERAFTKAQLYPLLRFFSKKKNDLHAFLGNKHNRWSSFILNQFAIRDVSLLDDGLSSYGISQQLYWQNKGIKTLTKKFLSRFFTTIGWHYFHESNNAEIDRKCKAYYFFPHLIKQPECVDKIALKSEIFHHYSKLCPTVLGEKLVHIASFEESQKIIKEGQADDGICFLLHPRVTGKPSEVPTEVILYHSKKASLSASSLIMYLVFIDYQGEYIFKNDDNESQKLLEFFQK